MDLRAIASPDAPSAVGPYVQAVAHAGLLYCSGALPIDPQSGDLDNENVAAEVARSLANLAAVCAEAGTGLDRTVRTSIYTTRLDLFGEINAVYADHFPDRVPARTTIGVAALPLGAVVEIDAIVAL
ncbi:Rid family detoxifying hydrolase [Nocardioides sp. YIM 152315]|uniref:Rid family detoxifying hydrolase n=1 Tax=Nocardioides sp. YIM 152315 TaxID=3031760 RepID=UPI0023DB3467|nr:Rid family detoxifying hydrolase [Nocardioides sp. YIM 152315]MDF1605863.1 Rid family detoxifying hydrolase [Nocardioides sp. YIM 152315]